MPETPFDHAKALPETIAAIDLGSNSFHLVVARPLDAGLAVIDRLREMVRLASGLDGEGRLTSEATARALECLARFNQRLNHLPTGSVRAVGTNTLRTAVNADEFIAAAEQVLGHPIEIISGVEEARLIYQGVSHSLADDGRRRLVIDIGGGSTEFIIGERYVPLRMESTNMGCVTMSQLYMPGGEITAKGMRKAELAALMHIEPYQAVFRTLSWDEAIGASGTLRAVERVCRESGWSERGITLQSLKKLVDALLRAGHADRLKLPGLSEKRAPVFAGGVAILRAAFEALGIEQMQVSEGALREGLLHDLLGRLRHEDVRDRAVAALAGRFEIDGLQAARVERTALALLTQTPADWGSAQEDVRQSLRWAAQLHEIGLAVSHSGHHKHGAYILENADLQGFSRQEQMLIAAIVRGHRRKFPLQIFKKALGGKATLAARLAIVLRLAAALHRSRSPAPLPPIQLQTRDDAIHLAFPTGWLDAQPLTRTDLEQEAEYLRTAGVKLEMV